MTRQLSIKSSGSVDSPQEMQDREQDFELTQMRLASKRLKRRVSKETKALRKLFYKTHTVND